MSGHNSAEITVTVNGHTNQCNVPVRLNLVDFLREHLGLTGTHVGCEHGICGSCHVEVDGNVVRGCLMFAVQADGADIVTIEGLSTSGEAADLQANFVLYNAMQCGFCTSGMIWSAYELLKTNPSPDREHVRIALSGNFCRCTGYQSIIDAVMETASERS